MYIWIAEIGVVPCICVHIYIYIYFLTTFSRTNTNLIYWKYVIILDISGICIPFAKSYECNTDQNWKDHLGWLVMIGLELEWNTLRLTSNFTFFFSLCGEAFCSRGAAGLVSVRRHKMSHFPCQTETVPGSSKMDLLLAKLSLSLMLGPHED